MYHNVYRSDTGHNYTSALSDPTKDAAKARRVSWLLGMATPGWVAIGLAKAKPGA